MATKERAADALVHLELHSAYNPRRIDVVQDAGGPSMTRQEMADECDINNIMKRYERTGMVPGNPNSLPQYLDLTVMPDDLMTAMNQMIDAENAFMSLPAVTRREFDNDAMRFVEYASNPENVERLREWGLAAPEKVPDPPIRVEVVGDPPNVPVDPPADSKR